MNKQSSLICIFAGSCLLIGSASARAEITYVDATWAGEGANTTLADGGAVKTTEDASSTDGNWRVREFGNGKILEAVGNNEGSGDLPAENVPCLKTTVGNGSEKDPYLPAGKYKVFVYFWQDEFQNPWRIEASLEKPQPPKAGAESEATNNHAANAGDAAAPTTSAAAESEAKHRAMRLFGVAMDDSDLVDDEKTNYAKAPLGEDDAGRTMRQGLVGEITLDGKTPLEVFVDSDSDLDGKPLAHGNSRTWYDGVGYELVP